MLDGLREQVKGKDCGAARSLYIGRSPRPVNPVNPCRSPLLCYSVRFCFHSGVTISLLLAVVGLICSFYLIRVIVKAPAGDGRMKEVASAIEEGAKAYLNRQVATIGVIAVVIFLLAVYFKGWPTAWGFLIGAACSLAAGFIGMRIAVLANVRTAQAAGTSRHGALCMAFNGGAVTGLLVVGLALLSVGLFYLVAVKFAASEQIAINSLIGLALGSSLISVFARLGGGIYTKAADVGADLVGKIESHLDEDDPRNPATIADNVGDNVGDCAGHGGGRIRDLRGQFDRRDSHWRADVAWLSRGHRVSVPARRCLSDWRGAGYSVREQARGRTRKPAARARSASIACSRRCCTCRSPTACSRSR